MNRKQRYGGPFQASVMQGERRIRTSLDGAVDAATPA